jgi:hydroxymethylpyrimidine pyrophosphatase-like HAD family hydrolase
MTEPINPTIESTVYVFDVDGVLCNIGEPIDTDVLRHIAKLLDASIYVAINTGRGYDRVGVEAIEPLREFLSDPAHLNHLFVSTEMGGVTIHFEDGEEVHAMREYCISAELKQKAVTAYKRIGAAMTMENYDYKKTMSTFVKIQEVSQADFDRQKSELVAELQQDFRHDDVTIATTVESVDVHARQAGKHAGAHLIKQWVQSVSDISHDKFICFGDSVGDYEMARYFAETGAETVFVFTGDALSVDEHDDVTVIDTVERYAAGTLEYLKKAIA